MVGKQQYNQPCRLAMALDVVGNRWAVLVAREMVLGPRRFTDIHAQLESASTDMVASRLREFEEGGFVRKREDRKWELTPQGYDLLPLVRALLEWSFRNGVSPQVLPTGSPGPSELDFHRRLLTMSAVALATTFRCLESNDMHELRIGELTATLQGYEQGARVTEGQAQHPASTLTFTRESFMHFVVFGTEVVSASLGGVEFDGDDAELVFDYLVDVLDDLRAGRTVVTSRGPASV